MLETLFLSFLFVSYPLYPTQNTTPGSMCLTSDPDFKEYRYPEKIPYCARKVSSSKKKRIYEKYGIPLADRSHYTIDHLVPLALGGSNHENNLWPEAKELRAKYRPTLEIDLYKKISRGEISQQDAVKCIKVAKFTLMSNCS